MFKATLTAAAKLPQKPVQGMATRGLFDGKHIYFGNSRSHSEIKTRRPWRPNVQTKHYVSELLNQRMKVKVTTAAIRSIDKAGGFDNYLVETRDERLGYEGSFGVNLKRRAIEAMTKLTGGNVSMDSYVTKKFSLYESKGKKLARFKRAQRQRSIELRTPEEAARLAAKEARKREITIVNEQMRVARLERKQKDAEMKAAKALVVEAKKQKLAAEEKALQMQKEAAQKKEVVQKKEAAQKKEAVQKQKKVTTQAQKKKTE